MDSVKFRGKWWLPEMAEGTSIPDNAVAGILSHTPSEGGKLDLIGTFTPFIEKIGQEPIDEEEVTIHGYTTDGTYTTLLNCIHSGITSSSGFETERYRFSRMIRRGPAETDSKYWKCTFSFQNLDNWTNLRRVTTPGNYLTSVGPAFSKSASTAKADVILNVYEDKQSSRLGNNIGSVSFSIWPDEPLTVDEYHTEYIRPLQNLVTLGVGRAVFPTFINLYKDYFGNIHSKRTFRTQLSNYYDPEERPSIYMNFTLPDIDFEVTIENWLNSYESIGRLHNHYFGTVYADQMYVQLQFMSMMFALEDYHRRTFPDNQKIMGKKVYERFRDVTLERLPPVSVQERAEGLFKSIMNEPSVRDRLEDITQRHEEVFPDSYNITSNLSTIVDTRHKIAHSLEEEVPPLEVKKNEIRLRVITLAVVLDIASVDPEIAREILENTHKTVRYISE